MYPFPCRYFTTSCASSILWLLFGSLAFIFIFFFLLAQYFLSSIFFFKYFSQVRYNTRAPTEPSSLTQMAVTRRWDRLMHSSKIWWFSWKGQRMTCSHPDNSISSVFDSFKKWKIPEYTTKKRAGAKDIGPHCRPWQTVAGHSCLQSIIQWLI